jgi:hypothetical protein
MSSLVLIHLVVEDNFNLAVEGDLVYEDNLVEEEGFEF